MCKLSGESCGRLQELSLLMTRETVHEPPQYHIMRLSSNGAGPQLRCLSNYPHPYPSLRDLQKEVIRCRHLATQSYIHDALEMLYDREELLKLGAAWYKSRFSIAWSTKRCERVRGEACSPQSAAASMTARESIAHGILLGRIVEGNISFGSGTSGRMVWI